MADRERGIPTNAHSEGITVRKEGVTEDGLNEQLAVFRDFWRDRYVAIGDAIQSHERVVACEDLPVRVDVLETRMPRVPHTVPVCVCVCVCVCVVKLINMCGEYIKCMWLKHSCTGKMIRELVAMHMHAHTSTHRNTHTD